MFTYLISEHLKRGGNVLVLTHRSELLKQAGSSFEKFGLTPEYITSGSKPDLASKAPRWNGRNNRQTQRNL